MEVSEPRATYNLDSSEFQVTDIGVIPREWHVASIGELAETSSGTTPPRSAYDRYYKGGTIAWVKTLDLNNSDIRSTDERVTPEALAETSLRVYPSGTVLVAMYGGLNQIGRTGLLNLPAAVNQALTAIRPRNGSVDSRYLLRVLNHRVDHWRSVASSSRKDPNITSKDVRDFALAIPRIEEQQAIAEALSDADALIESLSLLLAKKRQIKQGLMQELLTGKKRLPGFVDSWGSATIGSFTECTAGGTPSTNIEAYWGGDIPWMSSGELHLKHVKDVEGRITDEGLRNSSTKWVPAGCVLIGLAGQGKTRGTVAMNHVPLCTNQSIAAIFPVDSYDSLFLYFNLESRYEELRELSAGDGGRGGLNLSLIRNLSVPMPCLIEQREIARVLADIDSRHYLFSRRETGQGAGTMSRA